MLQRCSLTSDQIWDTGWPLLFCINSKLQDKWKMCLNIYKQTRSNRWIKASFWSTNNIYACNRSSRKHTVFSFVRKMAWITINLLVLNVLKSRNIHTDLYRSRRRRRGILWRVSAQRKIKWSVFNEWLLCAVSICCPLRHGTAGARSGHTQAPVCNSHNMHSVLLQCIHSTMEVHKL